MAHAKRTRPLSLFLITLICSQRTSSERTEDDDSTNRINDACGYTTALPCENGSTCKMGKADFGYHGTLNLPFLNKTAEEYMHCVCPEGFTGVLCEHHVQTCGDNEHACFNGATCVKKKDEQYSCDCMTTHNTNAYAGHMCEHAATSFCEYGVAVSKHSFCVNGGTCVKSIIDGDPHMGCNCPDGFSGEHCEYSDAMAAKYSVLTATSTPDGIVGFLTANVKVISLSAGIAIGALMLIYIMFIGVKIAGGRISKKEEVAATVTKDHSLTLEADGGTMPVVEDDQKQVEMKAATVPDTNGEFI